MRKSLIVALACAGLGAALPASAADLRPITKAPPPVVAVPLWSGFYVGVQGGYGFGEARQREITFITDFYDVDGGLIGVTWGANYQVGQTVVGIESDLAYSWIKGATATALPPFNTCGGAPARCDAQLEYLGTTRARLGYAWGSYLGYVTGGLAWGKIKASEGTSPIVVALGSGSESRYGWTLGGGVEAKFGGNWSAKVEYLFVNLRDGAVFVDAFPNGGFAHENVELRTHIVRAGLNYHFGEGYSFLPMLASAPIAASSWQGIYVGGTLGGGFGRARQVDAANAFDTGRYRVSGSTIGGTLGYNWLYGAFLAGFEGDLSYTSIEGKTGGAPGNFCFGNPGTCAVELDWLGTARVRVGYVNNRILHYVTGGIAWGSLHGYEGDVIANGGVGDGKKTYTGWVAGAGFEVKINSRWSTKFEYLYVDLGSETLFTDTFLAGGTAPQDVSFRTHIIRTGLNYSFNWDAPVVASRY